MRKDSQVSNKKIIVGLDVGTTKVCTIVGSVEATPTSQEIDIIGIGNHPSHGLKKGAVVNIDNTIRSIQSSLEEAKLMAGTEIESAVIGIAGSHIYSFNSSGVVPIKGHEIIEEDITRVLEAAKAVVMPSDRQILHVIPQEFKVDNTAGIKNPIGMHGVRLEASVHIVTGSIPLIQNLVKCVQATGVAVDQIMLQPLASSLSVLGEEERDMGVVLIDIGGGTTDIAIWKDGDLIHSQIIPVGGNHFTNDLAVALKTSHNEAERLKVNHGSVIKLSTESDGKIKVKGLSDSTERTVDQHKITLVLGARADELFSIISKIIEEKIPHEAINGGIVITGGGALIKGMAELCEFKTNLPAKIGLPISFGGMTNIMKNPKYSTVLGLLLESSKSGEPVEYEEEREGEDLFSKVSSSITSIFKEIF